MSILVEDELIIGRHAEGLGQLADDEEISRSHARISVDTSGFCAVEDLGSTNGTFVNGLRISSPQTLSEGDTIEVGQTTLVVRDLPSSAEEPSPLEEPLAAGVSQDLPPQGPVESAGADSPTEFVPEQPLDSAGSDSPTVYGREQPVESAGSDSPTVFLREVPAEPEMPPAPPPLSVHWEVDFVAREARLAIGEGSEPLRFVFDGTAWRQATSD